MQPSYEELKNRIAELEEELKLSKKKSSGSKDSAISKKEYNLFNFIKDGVAVYEPSKDGENFTVADMNYAGQQLCKIKIGEIIGENITKIFPGINNIGLLDVFKRVWKTGNPEKLPLRQYEDNNRLFWIENYVYKLPSGLIITIFPETDQEEIIKQNNLELQQFYNEIIESTNVITWSIDLKNQKYKYISPRIENLTGYKAHEWIDTEFWYNLVHKDDKKFVKDYSSHEIKRGRNHEFIYKIICKNKQIKWLRNIVYVHKEHKIPVQLNGYFIDITNLKISQKKLKYSEEKFITLYNNSPDMYISVSPDTAEILMCNNTFIDYTGYPRDEIIGTSVFDLYPEEMQKKAKKCFNQFQETGEVKNEELIITKKNNEKVFIEINENAIRDDEGKILYSMSSLRDISKRKRAETEVSKLLQTSADIINSIPSGLFIYQFVEPDKLILLDGNPEAQKITGLDIENYKGKEYNEIWSNAKEKKLIGRYLDAYHNETTIETEDVYYDKDDILRAYRIRAFRIQENKLIIAFENITKVKQTQSELIKAKEKAEESDHLKSSFIANLSHEIRTPMNGIIGFSKMLNKPNLTDDKRQKFTSIIIESSEQLLSIVNDILDISKIETGQVKIINEDIRINSLLDELLQIHAPKALKNDIQFVIENEKDEKDLIIHTDKTKVRQVLENLISNAIKFTDKGQIKIGYKTIDNNIEFYVKDTGIGIPKILHAKIFERFRQGELEMTRKYGGAGLGLSISLKLIEMLGGKIWLESNVNEGSTFYFNIPSNINNIKIQKESPEKNSITKRKNVANDNITILIAEDEDTNYFYLSEILSMENYNILHAKDGVETVKTCTSNDDIDIVLMDIKMPLLDGYNALKQIKQIKPDLPIIAQTAFALFTEKERIMQEGFDDYLTKPIDSDDLFNSIDKILKGKKKD